MYYGAIKKYDIANGPGVRGSLFVSGCTNRCAHCFQPETWDFTYGQPYTEESEQEILQALASPYITGRSAAPPGNGRSRRSRCGSRRRGCGLQCAGKR